MELSKKFFSKTEKYTYWLHLANTLELITVSILGLIIIMQLALPVRLVPEEIGNIFPIGEGEGSGKLYMWSIDDRRDNLSLPVRSGLFKPATPLRSNPVADRTVENIMSQISLKWITQIDGEPVAFITIKDKGPRQCRAGDTIRDMFTVLQIDKDSVQMSVVDHKVILSK